MKKGEGKGERKGKGKGKRKEVKGRGRKEKRGWDVFNLMYSTEPKDSVTDIV